MKKFFIFICLLLILFIQSCQNSAVLNEDDFSDYIPWWSTNSTNEVIND